MYLYIELWMPRPSWLELSEAERQDVVAGIGNGAAHFLCLIRNDGHQAYPSGCAYVAVWELADGAQMEALDALLRASWHEYFDEVNARGTADPPVEVLHAAGWRVSGNGSS